MKSNIQRHLIFCSLVGIIFSALNLIGAVQARENPAIDIHGRILEVEVSENIQRFIFDETPLTTDANGNDVPGDGNEFKTEGYIYEPGTLIGDGDGVNPDGSPQYPDRVIGRWTCWGFHVGNGAATETGPVVITHQLFDFGERFGHRSIVTAGFELVDIGEPIQRAITGGTGPYRNARGEVVQTLIGFNGQNGVNLHVRFKVNRF
ncbi:MAG: hypothetical protein JXR29_01985 [Methylothermaceae bacterium]|nr:hypothetical protein [Methylothermaceae bacterium]